MRPLSPPGGRRPADEPRSRAGSVACSVGYREGGGAARTGTRRASRLLHHQIHPTREPPPRMSTLVESGLALPGQLVDAPAPTALRRPAARQEPASLEPVQRRIDRPFGKLEGAIAALLELLDQRVPVQLTIPKAREKKEVEVSFELLSPHALSNYALSNTACQFGYA